MIKGYIFDLDGTLLDSMQVWDVLSIHYLEALGIKPEIDLVHSLQKMSLKEAALYIQETYHLDETLKDIESGFKKQLEKEYQNVTLKKGSQEFLEKCYKQNIKTCLLTANHQSVTEEVLKRLNIYHCFDIILSCQSIGYTKQDIKSYQYATQMMNLSINDCIVVEDALHAIITAKKAGFYVKAVYDESNQQDWQHICEIADENHQTLESMEV